MITAELNHNPYLLQTTVKFNGHAPRINSQIEKYQTSTLKDWVHRIPGIFYDEMNGFDFDLLFTGTIADFLEIQKAFLSAGVTNDQVRLIHQNELEDTTAKSKEIDDLLTWLDEHPNRRLDLETFRAANTDLFDTAYPYFLIRCESSDSFDTQIGIENIADIKELANTNLTHTPILFTIRAENRQQFRSELLSLLERKDVHEEQLFFRIHPALNADQVRRVICDLGVRNPQIVTRIDADEIMAYFRNYPITDYIHQAIVILRHETQVISDILEHENKESEIQNAGIHRTIDELTGRISQMKSIDMGFIERNNYIMPPMFIDCRDAFSKQVREWRNRKTKVIGESDGMSAAVEYEKALASFFSTCLLELQKIFDLAKVKIAFDHAERYKSVPVNSGFTPSNVVIDSVDAPACPMLSLDFFKTNEVHFEEPKSDFFARFKAPTEKKEPVRVVTFYYEQWRQKALEVFMPIMNDYIERMTDALRKYYNDLAESYHDQLTVLIADEAEKRDLVSSRLSDDERKLQEDNAWLELFLDQLNHIERG